MKIEVLQENLVKSVAWASRFVAIKPSLPILSKLKVVGSKGKLVLVATNMETGVRVEVGARVEGEGELAIPAKLLYEYINLLPAGKIQLSVENDGLKLVSAGYKARVAGESVADFPELPIMESKQKFRLSSDDLGRIVRLVGFCASSELTRPVLTAVLFEFKKSGLRVVSTDGYRLSMLKKIKISGEMGEVKLLIPRGVLAEVDRLVSEVGSSEVTVSYSEEQKSLVFEIGSVTVMSRLIEGEFPAYEKIIPKEGLVSVALKRGELMEVVKAASIFARDNAHIVKWLIVGGKLKVSAHAAAVGEQESEIDVEVLKEGEGEIAFNSRFLIDLLGSVSDGRVEFEMSDSLTPGLFRSSDKGFVHVVMPVRV